MKIIDFGMSSMPTKDQYLRFILGVSADYFRFSFTFVIGTLLPNSYTGPISNAHNDRIMQMLYELNREAYKLMRTDGKNPFPQSSEMLQVLENFKKLHGIENDPQYDE